MTQYFHRHGSPVTATVYTSGKKTYVIENRPCGRCGGAGRSDKWAHTGYTCFDCNGACYRGTHNVPVYTAEQLVKLNAAQEKRNAKKAAIAAEKAAAAKAQADAERDAFLAANAELIADMQAYAPRSEFIADILNKSVANARITENQANAVRNSIAKMKAEDARRANVKHVGTVGERVSLNGLTVFFTTRIDPITANGYSPYGPRYLTVLRTPEGSSVVYKGNYVAPKGSVVDVVATVKEHSEFRDEPQTKIQRPKFTIVQEAKVVREECR
jgi:Flp pilus assembly protein TadG